MLTLFADHYVSSGANKSLDELVGRNNQEATSEDSNAEEASAAESSAAEASTKRRKATKATKPKQQHWFGEGRKDPPMLWENGVKSRKKKATPKVCYLQYKANLVTLPMLWQRVGHISVLHT